MKTIEDHIQHDKELIADPSTSEPMKRHATEELHELQEYVGHHIKEIEAGDHLFYVMSNIFLQLM